MTISTTSNRVVGIGNGATTIWNYGFLIPDATEVVVQITDLTTGVVTTLTTLQYSITGIGNPAGGTVTYTPAITNNQTITIQRILPVKQLVSLSNQGSFYPTVVEGALDYLTMVCQQLSDTLSRAFTLSATGANTVDMGGARLTNLGAPVNSSDSVRFTDLQVAQSGANQVPTPILADVGKWLKATAAGAYAWTTLTAAAISDATAAGIALLTGANAAAQRTSLGLGSISLLNSIALSNIDRSALVGTPLRAQGSGADLAFTGIPGGAVIATTSGTALDLSTAVPSWVRRITILFKGVSTNGTSNPLIQVGSGSYVTTGYLGSAATIANGVTPTTANYTTGFGIVGAAATNDYHGRITLEHVGGNVWICAGTLGISTAAVCYLTSGSITLGGALDRVRITTVGGTDTFDAGSATVIWE